MVLVGTFYLNNENQVDQLRGHLFRFSEKTRNLPWDEADVAELWGPSYNEFDEVRVKQNGIVIGCAKLKEP